MSNGASLSGLCPYKSVQTNRSERRSDRLSVGTGGIFRDPWPAPIAQNPARNRSVFFFPQRKKGGWERELRPGGNGRRGTCWEGMGAERPDSNRSRFYPTNTRPLKTLRSLPNSPALSAAKDRRGARRLSRLGS